MFKKLISTLSMNRLIFYLIMVGLVPVFVVIIHYTKKRKEWEAVSEQIVNIQHFSAQATRKQSLNSVVRSVFAEADQFYLENQLEPLSFLKKERETLEQLLRSSNFTGNEAAEKRYSFLTSNANRFEWVQGSTQAAEGFQETDILLAHPLEIDAHDLKEILMRIEGNRKGKPQLIITDFRLHKKELSSGNEVFEVNMKLLKREFNA